MSVMSYEDLIDCSWLALAAAIISKRELSVSEALRLMGLATEDSKIQYQAKKKHR